MDTPRCSAELVFCCRRIVHGYHEGSLRIELQQSPPRLAGDQAERDLAYYK